MTIKKINIIAYNPCRTRNESCFNFLTKNTIIFLLIKDSKKELLIKISKVPLKQLKLL